jgi:hypothetical protein
MKGAQINEAWESRESGCLKRGKNNRRTERIAYQELRKFYSSLISNSARKIKPQDRIKL